MKKQGEENNEIKKIYLQKLSAKELAVILPIFADGFAAEPGFVLQKRRLKQLKRYYFLLYPFQCFLPAVRNLFRIFSIKHGAQTVGFIHYSLKEADHAHIEFIAIDPKWQRRGFARGAITLFLAEMKKQQRNRISLEVDAANPAVELYKSIGFSCRRTLVHFELPISSIDRNSAAVPFVPIKKADGKIMETFYKEYSGASYRPQRLGEIGLEKLKNFLLRYRKEQFVICGQDHAAKAVLTIWHYRQAGLYSLHLLLLPQHEAMRQRILAQALARIRERADAGMVNISMERQSVEKEKAVLALGFKCREIYYDMEGIF